MKCTPPASPETALFTLFLFAVLLLCRCTALTPIIQNDYNRTANFEHYRTYAWHPVEGAVASIAYTPAFSSMIDLRVKAAIESELLKKGLTPATTRAPDLLLAYDISVNPTAELPDTSAFVPGFGFGYGYWYGYRYNYNYEGIPTFRNVRDYAPGTLIIDFIDPSSNELVWRGWTESNLNVTTLQESKISRAVARIIAQYPPRGPLR
ncbi:DUF4136 domain-containing protein [Botryobacter ruber]|uniref:DUF4136 domain-containing protein n=1 Tax=Botryobacter ruber TaxID=2171629 RepID=UPI000E0A456A|nr:DUF4136 domain-containing protein [Botryobacter ruber]